jgi:hypothetical protein
VQIFLVQTRFEDRKRENRLQRSCRKLNLRLKFGMAEEAPPKRSRLDEILARVEDEERRARVAGSELAEASGERWARRRPTIAA